MVDGTTMIIMDGLGYLGMSGLQLGFLGEVVVDTTDGLQCLLDLI
jgi:hypothetical protein